ncbi:MAG: MBL fold metallo-hydrolase [Candidatus Thermoplasmatota archaeon]|nr:MBL fold metallo-hydrolase [Candidatus Thermoplasmatota archaeon]
MDSIFFKMISSGSKGNCTLIWDSSDLLIIDFGISAKRFLDSTSSFNIPRQSQSLFISHEHRDHCQGTRSLTKKIPVDIYSRKGTIRAMGLDSAYTIGESTTVGNFSVKSIDVSHDATEPVGYVIQNGERKISVISDLGKVSSNLIDATKGSDILAFEANHDTEMLKSGNYPYYLKKRILGESGHLSNEQSAEAISMITSPETHIFLTHISQENNRPEIALNTVKSFLDNRNISYGSILCSYQDTGTPLLELRRH